MADFYGCKDERALNYNPNAIHEDISLCIYRTDDVKTWSVDPTDITFLIKSKPDNATILIDDIEYKPIDSDGLTIESIKYNIAQIRTAKIIKVETETLYASSYYRIRSEPKQKIVFAKESDIDETLTPIDVTAPDASEELGVRYLINFNVVVVQKWDAINMVWKNYPIQNYNPIYGPESLDTGGGFDAILGRLKLPTVIELDYELDLDKALDAEDRIYTVDFLTDLPNGVKLEYWIDGELVGELTPTLNSFVWQYPSNERVEFKFVGIDEEQYDVRFIRPSQTQGQSNITLPGEFNDIFFEEALVFDDQIIEVEIIKTGGANKVPIFDFLITGGANPLAIVNKFNISDSTSEFKLPYYTTNADSVTFSMANVQRELESDGSLVLYPSDFTEGLGSYTLVFQPYRTGYGYGPEVKLVVFLEDTISVPGPDIVSINYPQVVEGLPKVEYDVDFKINWNAVNTDYVEIYINYSRLSKEVKSNKSSDYNTFTGGTGLNSETTFLGKFDKSFAILNIKDMFTKARIPMVRYRDISNIHLYLQPVSLVGASFDSDGNPSGETRGKKEFINITFNKGDTLKRTDVVTDIKNSFFRQLDTSIFDLETSKLLTHFAHFGDGDNKLIATWGIDSETFSEYGFDANGKRVVTKLVNTLVLKMYEPLPEAIQPNDLLWISKIQSLTTIEEVKMVEDVVSYCTPLKPNFELEKISGVDYKGNDDITSDNEELNTSITNKLKSQNSLSLLKLNLGYTRDITEVGDDNYDLVIGTEYAWDNFVRYSSARERVTGFYFKIKKIEAFQNKIDAISVSPTAVNSVSVSLEIEKLKSSINEIIQSFDGFEWFLYGESNSFAYPKDSFGNLKETTHSDTIDWYQSALVSADEFDRNNPSRLTNNVPTFIKTDYNKDHLLFFDMIGHHFDILHSYIKSLTKTKKIEHVHRDGIFDDLLKSMLESLGWDTNVNTNSDDLWQYLFGLDTTDSTESKTTGKDKLNQIWRRLLNNLPYIYKTKGTRRGVQALLSIYGIPSSILSIMEYAAPSLDGDLPTNFTYDEDSISVVLSGGEKIRIPWKEYTTTGDHPNTVQIRFKVDELGNYILTQTDNTWGLGITAGTGSLGKIDFFIDVNGSQVVESTEYVPIFNDEFYYVTVVKEEDSTNENYTVYLKDGFQGRTRNYTSASLSVPKNTTSWKSGSYLDVGSGSLGTFSGEIDEVRLWSTPLEESKIAIHALVPDSIAGNHLSASSDDLLFRLDFEYPKDLNSNTNILNVAINDNYGEQYAEAVGFESNSEYPYQYSPYTRTVTTKAYPIGFSYSDKINIVDTTLVSDLSYRSRSTEKISKYVNSDTNKVGIYVSPSKEINLDIIKSIGDISLDDYLGNYADEYNHTYSDLDSYRKYYFQRYNFDFNQYIQIVRGIDNSLFKILRGIGAARNSNQTGLLIEPHFLQRSKYRQIKPTGDLNSLSTNISSSLLPELDISLSDLEMAIDTNKDVLFEYDYKDVVGDINTYEITELSTERANLDVEVDLSNISEPNAYIERNKNSTMGGFEFEIDTELEQQIIGEYENTSFVTAGALGDIAAQVGGFGYWGQNAHSIITEMDAIGQVVQRRLRAYKLKIKYNVEVPYTSGSVQTTQIVENYKYVITLLPIDEGISYKLVEVDFNDDIMILNINGVDETFGIRDIDLENGLWELEYPISSGDWREYELVNADFTGESIEFKTSIFSFGVNVNVEPEVKNEVVAVEALNNNFNQYVYNYNDLPTGLNRSYSYGSQQTNTSTPDGEPAVQTFTTNPNTLRVNKSGRGSGEPILEVE
jgi:hypothetical protein